MKLTKDFILEEFACHDSTPVPVSKIENVKQLAINLQILRDELGEPISILSGYRTPSWNKKVGGVPKSMHLQAKAGDLTTRSLTPKQLHTFIEGLIKIGKIKNGGLGLYPSFVHYDTGPVRRWNG